jgi:hypothetical protein
MSSPEARPEATGANESAEPRSLASGAGRLIVGVYAVFALSAGVRAGYQVATKFDEAPISYSLSVLAAAIYLVAAIALVKGARTIALAAVGVEMVGVIGVGALSLAVPDWFPEASVWSEFGIGYGFVPLVLPVAGLLFLWWRGRRS